LIGRWRDAAGNELPDGTDASGGIFVVSTAAVSTSCTQDNVTVIMELAWPVGTQIDTKIEFSEKLAPRFLRDTNGSLIRTEGESALDVSLPSSAKTTGFNREGNTIYVVPTNVHAVYVKRNTGRVERWAKLKAGQGCA
jgi:hypothetical protein